MFCFHSRQDAASKAKVKPRRCKVIKTAVFVVIFFFIMVQSTVKSLYNKAYTCMHSVFMHTHVFTPVNLCVLFILLFVDIHHVWESNIFSLSVSAKVTSRFKILCHTNNTPLAGPTFGKHLLFFNIFSIKSPSIGFSKWKLIICYFDRSKPTSFTLESATSRKLSQAVYCCLLSMTKSPSWNYKPEPSRSDCFFYVHSSLKWTLSTTTFNDAYLFPFAATQQWFTASDTLRAAIKLQMTDLILIINNVLALISYSTEKKRIIQY